MSSSLAESKMKSQLAKLCRECEYGKEKKCPYSKKDRIGCKKYVTTVAKTFLMWYSESDLKEIPAYTYGIGLRAHQYVGEVVHYSTFEYAHLPLEFFLKGIRAHGYKGELRKTEIVKI